MDVNVEMARPSPQAATTTSRETRKAFMDRSLVIEIDVAIVMARCVANELLCVQKADVETD